jgi:hypothetical protein
VPYITWKQVRLGFPSLPQNWWRPDGGGARGIIVKVAWRLSQRQMGQCDELRRTLLSLLYHFHYIRPYEYFSHLVFFLSL